MHDKINIFDIAMIFIAILRLCLPWMECFNMLILLESQRESGKIEKEFICFYFVIDRRLNRKIIMTFSL